MTINDRKRFRALARIPVLVLASLCVLVAVLGGCSKGNKTLAEVKKAYETKDYSETVALCKFAIRRQRATPEVYYYYGASLIALDRDYEGFRRLEEAISGDMSLAPDAGELLFAAALGDVGSGRRAKAARRMQKAVEYDPSVELGPHRFLVADVYFKEKNYGRAAPFYAKAIAAHADTSILESAWFNMAVAYDEMGWNTQAREAFEMILELYPQGEFRSESSWRLSNLLYEDAEKQHVLGNYEEAVEALSTLVERTSNRGLLQKSRFLLGESYEAMGDYDDAYREYTEVIRVDRGASGRIVERAREKIAALQEAGLY